MTILDWTLWVVGLGLALIALLFAIFKYLNKRGHRKISVIKKSFSYGLTSIIVVYLLGLLLFVEWGSRENAVTKEDFAQLRADVLNIVSEPTQKEVESEIDKQFKTEFEKKKKKALEAYQEGLRAYYKANFMIAIGHFKKAIKIFAIPSFYIYRGNCYNQTNQFGKALADFNKALELNPNWPEVYNSRGIAFLKKGDYDKAFADYNTAIELNPNNAKAYNNRGNVLSKKGDHDKALADFNKAIELNPNYDQMYPTFRT